MKSLAKLPGYPFPNSGSILIITIWTLTILALLGLALTRMISPQIKIAKYLEERLFSLHLAKSAYRQAVLERQGDETPDYDSIYELSKHWSRQLGRGRFSYQLNDEEGKININAVPREVIARLPGLDFELTTEIVDPERRPFAVKEELLLIEDMDQEIYSQFEDLITVYGGRGVNINTAPAEILGILGLSDDLIETIIRFRNGDDEQENTEDDRIFKHVASLLNDLRVFTILSDGECLQITELLSKKLLCVKSENFNMRIATEVSGRPVKTFTIIWGDKEASGAFSKIRYWSER